MFFFKKEETIGIFRLSDYSDPIERFPSEKILGPINSSQVAKKEAEVVWMEIYGESIKTKKPYEVLFDEANQVWLVQGTLPKNIDGGVPYMLIQKLDGKVLAIWHDK